MRHAALASEKFPYSFRLMLGLRKSNQERGAAQQEIPTPLGNRHCRCPDRGGISWFPLLYHNDLATVSDRHTAGRGDVFGERK